jgi:hypothetical protein
VTGYMMPGRLVVLNFAVIWATLGSFATTERWPYFVAAAGWFAFWLYLLGTEAK